MGYNQGLASYQDVKYQTADPAKLILMMYDRLSQELEKAKECIKIGNFEDKGPAIIKSQDIVMELANCLNLNTGKIAENLQSLYLYMFRELNEINLKLDMKKLEVLIKITDDIRSAWVEITNGAKVKS